MYALSLEHNLPPLASLAPERCCFIASTSEALSGGLRIAYLCPPDAVFAELERTISYTISMAPPLMAELATMWIRNGTADRVLAAKRREAAERNALARQLLDGFPLETRTTGFFCWLKLPDPWAAVAFAEAARQRGSLWRTVTCSRSTMPRRSRASVWRSAACARGKLWRTRWARWLGCCTGRVLWERNIGRGGLSEERFLPSPNSHPLSQDFCPYRILIRRLCALSYVVCWIWLQGLEGCSG